MTSTPRNIIITGAGSGIGAATARVFSASGDRVHLFDLSSERLNAVAAELDNATTYVVDVTDGEKVRAAVEQIYNEFGTIEVVVSNAGVFDGLSGIEETSNELWNKIIGTNLTGAFNVIKPVSEAMVRQNSGRIIIVGSIAATRALPDGLSYVTSKAGLEGMARRLAVDLGGYGITANVVAPGAIDTPILSVSREILGDLATEETTDDNGEFTARFLDTVVPARRTGKPEEVAATIHFLASEGAAYINGETIRVDGGWTAS